MFGLFNSCGKLFWREVKCRNFEFQDELKWYPGTVGDVITLSNKENETNEFTIRDKYIHHRTKYISDTGCGCHDWWGIFLTSKNDTINMYGHSRYIEDKPAHKYNYLYFHHNYKQSGFIDEDKSIANNYTIEDKTFAQVLIFEYAHTENNQFKKVIIAPEIGVIELIEVNGNVWKNTDLETKLNIDMKSFEYKETTCE